MIKLIHVLRIQKAAWGRELDGVHWCWCLWNFWIEIRRKYVGLLETYMDLLSEKREQNNQERLGVPWPFRSHPNHGHWVAFFCELHSKSWPCCEAWAPACSVSSTGCNACDDERLGKDQWVEGGLGYVAIAVCWIFGKKVNFLVFTKLRSRTLKVLSEKATEQKETLSQLRQQADQARTDVKTCKAWFGSVFVHCCVVSFCFLVVVF